MPDKDWYSFKHHKACVAYEIGVHLFDSKIVWLSGPHKGGETDLVIFRKEVGGLKSMIPHDCYLIGDKGYVGEERVSVNNRADSKQVQSLKKN